MATTEITVQYCNPQQPGKKNASIKTNDGQLYFVAPEMFSQFEQGGRYNIQYKVSSFRGVQYRHVETVTKIAPSPAANGGQFAGAKGKYGTVDMETAERIFVSGWMNGLARNPNIDPRGLTADDLVVEVNKIRTTWSMTLGNPQKSDDLDDEIPF